MRPIRLDLNGFASFRDTTTIDFSNAEYFALVGPTGSGKSTVIDAITFALYGSAPRWGSMSSIQYALAPTANRCTVRLVFDVADQRYVVAREVRRSGVQIMQKNIVLERYLHPGATGDPHADEPTESLAGDPKAVRQQVIDLLGLEFDDFCTCVVLPQGDFATFLKASVTERQNILLKLLGAKHYDAIGKLAGRRAADAAARIEIWTGQLSDYADATEESESAARAREAELESLRTTVQKSVDLTTELAASLAQTAVQRDLAIAEAERLSSVKAPVNVVDLQTAIAAAERAYHDANEHERAAAAAAVEADRALQTGPRRQPLEETLRWRTELATGYEQRKEFEQQECLTRQERRDAEVAASEAKRQLDRRRGEDALASSTHQVATAEVETLQRRITVLLQVTAQNQATGLSVAAAHARAARDTAEARRRSAETELTAARRAVDGLPERSWLHHLRRTIDQYEQTAAKITALRDQQRAVAQQADVAWDRLNAQNEERDAASVALDTRRTKSTAAALRPHLRVGEPCPVCDQSVATLPPPLQAPELDAAIERLDHAMAHAEQAAEEHSQLTNTIAALAAQLSLVSESAEQLEYTLTAQFPNNPSGLARDVVRDRTVVQGLLDQLAEAINRSESAAVDLDDALGDWRSADQECQRIEKEYVRAWADLHATRGPLLGEGPPEVHTTDLAAAWKELETWATMLADKLRSNDLVTAQAALRTADDHLAIASSQLEQAITADNVAAEALTAAAVAEQKARSDHQHLLRRLDELETLLANRPSADEARNLLEECECLEAAASRARLQAQVAANARQAAEQDRDALRVEHEQARIALHRARDGLIELGAPAVDGADIARAWATLTAWSGEQANERHRQVDDLAAELTETDRRVDHEVATLAAALDAYGIDPAAHQVVLVPGHANAAAQVAGVPAMMLVEWERARSHTAEIRNRRHAAENLRRRIAADTETQQVAAELQRLMSSKRFPQWLADAALDTLVADASASLMRLSNSQFDLTHDRGEFYVIDHADADSRRSVRTLSGGETFQASLALALALSEQLATLAAGGRTTLDSIFLDEGFGTLDPDALEIVAGTLENLAQEDRMVGVITHVTALAERVPVRYEVNRDSRTSSIVRSRS
jgi:DNA repair protein SbcC/Rad50